jgi:glycosyltransferase involved in cell wall biosynthesis
MSGKTGTAAAVVRLSTPYRVLSVAHSAVTRGTSRIRYWPIAAKDYARFTLVVPARWHEYGRTMLAEPAEPELDIRPLTACLTKVGSLGWYLHFYFGLGRLLWTLRADVIHLWEEPWSLVALQAILLRALLLPRAAIVLETEQNISRRLPPPFEQIRRFTLSRTEALIVRSAEALTVARACGYQGPATTVEYCVDSSRFNPGDRGPAKLTKHADELLVGYAGRLIQAKGLSKVVEAVAHCRAKITLLLLGDGPEATVLQRQVEVLGVNDRVRILPSRSPEGVAAFMREIDVLVLFSQTTRTWKEQFGRVIIEAQACGTPVIGSDSGAVPSVVGAGGWIVGEGDVAGLAALLDRLADDPVEVAAKAAEGAAQVARRFTPEKVAGDLCNIYRCAVERRIKRRKEPSIDRGAISGWDR